MKVSLGRKPLVYPTPVFVIGTYDKDSKPNVMTASWSGICCSDPPCIAVSLRKATYTYGNMMERKAFTVNVPSKKYINETKWISKIRWTNKTNIIEIEIPVYKNITIQQNNTESISHSTQTSRSEQVWQPESVVLESSVKPSLGCQVIVKTSLDCRNGSKGLV